MNTIPSTPGTAEFGSNIVASLGSFWTTLYQDSDLVKSYGGGTGIDAAQIYLNFLEVAATLGKASIPVFHREQWHPIIIRKSRRDVGNNLKIPFGQQPLVSFGPQPTDTEYLPEKVYSVGGPANRFGQVGYETIIRGWAHGIDRVMDQIVDPQVVLLRNVHFQIKADTITFLDHFDPFDNPSFPRRVVRDPTTGEIDEEILLWGTHALTDNFYVRDHFGYAINLNETSTQLYLDRVCALWNLRFGGTTLEIFKEACGQMLGVQTIREDGEVIEQVYTESNGDIAVVTDKHAYRFTDLETLRPVVVPGASFNRGDYLTNTIKLYHKLDTTKFFSGNGRTLDEFLADVPALFLPKALIGNYSAPGGFIAKWEDTDIVFHGNDANGNPKLRFALGGQEQDLDLFWEEIWARAEQTNQSLADTFAEFLSSPPPYLQEGITVGTLNPLKFYMDNCLKANASVLVVDFPALRPYIRSLDILARLRKLIPAHTFLFIVARQEIAEEPFDLGLEASDELEKYHGKALEEIAGEGAVGDTLNYGDSIITRWVKKCS
jgi:hypothetical protein